MTSLRAYLDLLADDEILRIQEPLDLDYIPTALVLELERRKKFPVVYMEQPQGFDMPVVAKEAHVFQRLKEVIPNVVALNYPKSGTHFHAYLSLNKTAEGQARQALMLLFGLDSYIKLAVVVDDDIDTYSEEDVLWAIATRFQADTDMFVVPKVFCNRPDPSSVDGMSAKLGLDATAPLEHWDVERTSHSPEAVEAAKALIARLNL